MTPTTFSATQTAPAPAAQTSTTQSAEAAPKDFMSTLGQLVGGAPVATSNVAPQLRSLMNGKEGVAGEDPDALDVLGMLPISLPAESSIAAAVKNALASDIALEVQFSRGGARMGIDAEALKMLSAPSANAESSVTFDSVLSPHALSESQQPLRAASAESMLTRTVQTPVGSAAWADEIGSRMTMMAEQGRHTASLRLSPEHLGPLEVRIAIRDDQASVWFGAAHADTRAAIEQALPRLRELFEAQGMSLTDAGVFQEAPREQPTKSAQGSISNGDVKDDESASLTAVQVKLGLIDAYA